MKRQNVSDAVIKRLPRYYRYLDDLHLKGIVRISSSTLGEKMGITASQIRQDLSCFGEFGQQGYGYNVEELRAEIGRILGVNNQHSIIVVGAGNLGRALMQNFHFKESGFRLLAAFDIAPALIGTEIAGGAGAVRARPPAGRGGAHRAPVRGPEHGGPPHRAGDPGFLEFHKCGAFQRSGRHLL